MLLVTVNPTYDACKNVLPLVFAKPPSPQISMLGSLGKKANACEGMALEMGPNLNLTQLV